MEYNSSPIPTKLANDISRITTKYKKPSFCYSMIFLVHDLIICGLIYLCYPYLPYILYSGLMGTAAMGLWVLGHECGHGAFGNSKIQNDLIGFILHSSLLVPYFSWKYTHNKHHKFTNHLIYGETHVPETAKEVGWYMGINKILGEDSFTMVIIFTRLILGWPAYLFTNVSGGRTTFDLKTETKEVDLTILHYLLRF